MFLRKLTPAALAGFTFASCAVMPARGQFELVSDDPVVYDHRSGELRALGSAELRYQGTLLTANEILFNQQKQTASATGDLRITSPDMRIVGETASYSLEDKTARGANLRFGQPPFHAEVSEITATENLVQMRDGVFYYGDPRPLAINFRARQVNYIPNESIQAESVTLRLGKIPFFYLPSFSQSVGGIGTEVTANAGYGRNLGAFVFVGTRTPLFPGFSAGPELGYYGRRGLLAGPGFSYEVNTDDYWVEGNFSSGYINDRGDTGLDRLDRPIDDDRSFLEWRHKQRFGESLEFTAQADIWSDSEVTRDFRPRLFNDNQFPDNFFEAAYLGNDYIVSAFTRVSPNDFQVVPERLPEIRFDLLPQSLGPHFYHQLQASAAILNEEDPFLDDLRSERLDLYYGLHWPIVATDWLTITPKAGARVTHYERTLENRDDYTRVLGEIGADAEMNAFAIYDYHNELWGIQGIRHVVKPRIHYRFIPEADHGSRFIPQIETQPFTTQLEPIDLGHVRHLDEMTEIHTLRYGLDNLFQTRDDSYGSRDLLSVFVANDLRFSRDPGQEFVSDVHTQISFTPIYWLRFDTLSRVSPQQPEFRELNTALTLTDARFWSLRLGTEYTEGLIEQYSMIYALRLNETYRVIADLRYDANRSRFSRQSYSLVQNLYNSWEVQYQVYFNSGADREGSSGVGVSFTYLSF